MGKKRKEKDDERTQGTAAALRTIIRTDDPSSVLKPDGKVSRKAYDQALFNLHVELVKVQQWVQTTGAKVCVIFEGRDGAGKGGTIKAITERVSPRVFRVVALPAPTEREKSEVYFQRYISHLPAGGEIVIFDRSWYNRAGIEKVMGFASEGQVATFLAMAPDLERAIVDSGVILLKYWLEVGQEEQTRRLEARITDGRKLWKLSPMDLKSYSRWYDFSRARDAMFQATDTSWAPWYVVPADDKKRARLNVILHLLCHIPYEQPERQKAKLPHRHEPEGYVEPEHQYRTVADILGSTPISGAPTGFAVHPRSLTANESLVS